MCNSPLDVLKNSHFQKSLLRTQQVFRVNSIYLQADSKQSETKKTGQTSRRCWQPTQRWSSVYRKRHTLLTPSIQTWNQPCLQGFLQLFHLCSPRIWFPTVGHFNRKFMPLQPLWCGLLLLLSMPEHLHFTVLPKHVLRRALSRSPPFHQLQQPVTSCHVARKIDES